MSKKRKTTTKKVKRRRLKPKAAVFLLCFFGGLFLIIFYFTKTNVTHVYVEGNDYLSVSYILKKSGLETLVSTFKKALPTFKWLSSFLYLLK